MSPTQFYLPARAPHGGSVGRVVPTRFFLRRAPRGGSVGRIRPTQNSSKCRPLGQSVGYANYTFYFAPPVRQLPRTAVVAAAPDRAASRQAKLKISRPAANAPLRLRRAFRHLHLVDDPVVLAGALTWKLADAERDPCARDSEHDVTYGAIGRGTNLRRLGAKPGEDPLQSGTRDFGERLFLWQHIQCLGGERSTVTCTERKMAHNFLNCIS